MKSAVKIWQKSLERTKVLLPLFSQIAWCLPKPSKDISTACNMAAPYDGISLSEIPSGLQTSRGAVSLLVHIQILSRMQTAKNLSTTHKVRTVSTLTHETGASVKSFKKVLHGLCSAKLAVDDFYNSQQSGVMQELPGDYLAAEAKLCEAIQLLSNYLGVSAVAECLNPSIKLQ